MPKQQPTHVQINEQARKAANLRLLQRSMDSTINDILGSATHVVLYNFNTSSNAWEKSNVEGSLFLCSKSSAASSGDDNSKYTIVILNRNSPDNYPLPLDKEMSVDLSDPYLIFKNKSLAATGVPIPQIRGVWFPNDQERNALNGVLQNVLQTLKTQPPALSANPRQQQPIDTASATAALLATLNVNNNSSGSGGANNAQQQQQQQSSPSNLPPRSGSPGRGGVIRQPSPTASQQTTPRLDKKSLQLALLSLIQDDRFLDLLHAQYLKVHHARTNQKGNNNQNGGGEQQQQQQPR